MEPLARDGSRAPLAVPGAVHGPGSFFLTGEDFLRVRSFGSLASTTVVVVGRRLTLDGQVVPFRERHVPTTDRTQATTYHTIGDGWLLNVAAYVEGSAPRRGQVFVTIDVHRGRTAVGQVLGTLLQGYVTASTSIAWPGSPIASSIDGPGVVRSITGADPAAGAECSDAVPTNARWRFLCWRGQLVTDATVANRTAYLLVDDGATTLFSVAASAAQTATLTRQYGAYPSGGAPRLDGTQFYLPTVPDVILMGGYRIRTSTVNIAAGDNWAAPQLLVEEWIED